MLHLSSIRHLKINYVTYLLMSSITKFTTGVYKGKTYEEVYEILQTTDKSFLKKLKGKNVAFLDYYTERESKKAVSQLEEEEKLESVVDNSPLLVHNLPGKDTYFIYQLADIHIKSYEKMDEYLSVFERLYELLRNEPPGLIVICGDIMHNKSSLSPATIVMTHNFLTSLAEIHPVVFIAGNHDANLRNEDRIDALTAIMTGIKSSNIHYFRDTGIYNYGNITFGVTSILQKDFLKNPRFALANELPDNGNIKIALFHGQVSCFDVGFAPETIYDKKYFDGYDYTLLGDAHSFKYAKDNKNMAYSSSLISQTFKEVDLDHGYLKWDLKNKTSSYQRVPNDYQHQAFEIKNNLITYNFKDYLTLDEFKTYAESINLPSKGYYRIQYDETEYIDVRKFVSIIENNTLNAYCKVERIYQPLTENIENSSFRNEPSDNLKLYCAMTNLDYDKIAKELGFLGKDVIKFKNTRSNWKLTKLKLENMFGYAGVNIIDFRKYPEHEIVGIFAENKGGKSTIVNSILFLLFGKCPNVGRNNIDLIHADFLYFNGELEFMIGTDTYTIKRSGSVPSRDNTKIVKINVSFYKNGISLEEEQKKETNKEIEKIIGPYDMFMATSVFEQQSSKFFMKKTESEKKTFLYDILQLDLFQDIEEKITTQNTLIRRDIQKLTAKMKGVDIEARKLELEKLDQDVMNVKKQISDDEESYKSKEDSINKKLAQKHNVLSKEAIETKIYETENKINSYEREIEEMKKSLQTFESKLETYSLLNCEEQIVKEHEQIQEKILLLSQQKKPSTSTVEPRAKLEKQFLEIKKKCDGENRPIYDLNNEVKKLMKTLKISDVEEVPNKVEVNTLKQILDNNKDIEDRVTENKKRIILKQDLEIKLKRCLEVEAKFKSYEYNPDCKFCVVNPFVVSAKEEIKKIPQLQEELSTCVIDNLLDGKFVEYNLAIKRYEFLRKQANIIEENTKSFEIQKKIEELETITEAFHKKEQLEKKINFLDNKNIEDKIIELKSKDKYDSLCIEKKTSKAIRDKLTEYTKKIHELTVSFESSKSSLIEYEDMIHPSKENEIINQQVKLLRTDIQKLQQQVINKIKILSSKERDYERVQGIISVIEKDHMEFTELIEKEKLYLQLKTLVSKNGFPLFLLKQYIPFITTGINAFISHFIDRRIDIEIVGDHIYVNSWEGKTCINVLSGAEEFLYELGFKFVFSTLAQLPQSNILFIDEQLGCLDAKKMREFDKVTEFLRKNYTLSFIISHIGTVQNYINHNMNIKKNGNKSRLIT